MRNLTEAIALEAVYQVTVKQGGFWEREEFFLAGRTAVATMLMTMKMPQSVTAMAMPRNAQP